MNRDLKQLADCCCKTGMNIARIREMFSLLSIDLFNTPENFDVYREELSCITALRKSDTDPGFYVGPTHTERARAYEGSTGVFISCRNLQLEKLFLDNRVGNSPDNAAVVRVKKATATVTIRHRHKDPDIAILMGESTLTHIEGLRPLIKEVMPGLLGYECVSLQEVKQKERAPNSSYEVDLAVQVEYQMLVTTYEESHRLKKFGFAVEAE